MEVINFFFLLLKGITQEVWFFTFPVTRSLILGNLTL